MSIVVVTPPAPLVSLDETKVHLRVDHGDDDALIGLLIRTASQHLDGPQGVVGRCFGVQTLELGVYAFGRPIVLPYPPVVDVLSVTYADALGVDQTWAEPGWRLVAGDADQWELHPAYGATWPAARADHRSVRVRYRAGYETVPDTVRAAVLLLIGHLYENRGSSVEDALNGAASALLAPFQRWSV